MLRIASQILLAFDVNVTYAQPHSESANVNNVKFDGCPTSVLNIGCAIFLVVYLYTWKNALRKQRVRRKYFRE